MTRRSLLPLLAFPHIAKPALSKLETFVIKVNHRGNWVLVRLTTPDGITGIGDASHGQKDEDVLKHVHSFYERLKGLNPWDIERFRQQCFPELAKAGRSAVVAYSALEQCCWDIRGRMLGRPVYDLLGGRIHDKIRTYANINRATISREPETFGQLGAKAVAAGFDAIKLASFDGMPRTGADAIRAHTDRGIACVAAVRKSVGDRAEILVDGHSNFNREDAISVMRRLEPLRLYWLEEMTPGIENLAAVNRAAPMQTAGGESLFGTQGFYPYIAGGAVDIVMPDVKYCGGVWEMKKIAAIAEGAGLKVSPHGPASPVGNAVAAHVCATLPNFTILEIAFGEVPWRAEVIDPPESVIRGHLNPSNRPGFGITLNESALNRYRA